MVTVLTTESGGPAAVGLIKSLRALGDAVHIVATDASPLAAGLHLADHKEVVPYADDPAYIGSLLKVVEKYKVNFILPTGEHDLQTLAQNKQLFESAGCTVFVSSYETINTCQDKFKFYQALKNTEIPVPATFNVPMIIKPVRGSGSRGIKVLPLKEEIIQEYIPGTEYTVDVFCDMNSQIINHVIRERVAIKAGISTQGRTVRHPAISKIVTTMVEHLQLKGPLCIQLRENSTGNPVVIECNPRLGGGTYMCTLAGLNYGSLYYNLYRGLDMASFEAPPKKITVVRYFEEIVL